MQPLALQLAHRPQGKLTLLHQGVRDGKAWGCYHLIVVKHYINIHRAGAVTLARQMLYLSLLRPVSPQLLLYCLRRVE